MHRGTRNELTVIQSSPVTDIHRHAQETEKETHTQERNLVLVLGSDCLPSNELETGLSDAARDWAIPFPALSGFKASLTQLATHDWTCIGFLFSPRHATQLLKYYNLLSALLRVG